MTLVQAYVCDEKEGCYSERMTYEVNSLEELKKIHKKLKSMVSGNAKILFEILEDEE